MTTARWPRWLCAAAGVLLAAPVSFAATGREDLAELGRALFFDASLSANGNQSCASCHDPGRAFSDGRDNGVSGAVSLGDDGRSLGDRNAPATSYAALVPDFQRDAPGDYVGGFFLDGRAGSLEEQAAEPFVNPREMNLPDHAELVARVRSRPGYASALRQAFGDGVFGDTAAALRAISAALAEFERSDLFAPFDSRYDRYLKGEVELTADEELGRVLFFSQLVNCSSCHLLDTREYTPREVFTNHRYHNIGVPANAALRAIAGTQADDPDPGLYGNPAVDDPATLGKFRVPSLRNVAVTGPYMHNGVFRELRTAIRFYNRFTLGNAQSQTNPETGATWAPPEVPDTVDLDLLSAGQPLAENHVVALEAFLRALTDRRYEALLEPPPASPATGR